MYSAVYFSRLHCVLTCGKSLEVLGISIGCVMKQWLMGVVFRVNSVSRVLASSFVCVIVRIRITCLR